MRKLLAALAVLLAAGCDDPAVTDRALSVLEHGAVQAEVKCDSVLCSGSQVFSFKASLLQDGSSIVSYSLSGPFTSFNKRGDAVQVCEINGPERCFTAVDGDLTIVRGAPGEGGCNESFPLDGVSCDGFNLEAFGVE